MPSSAAKTKTIRKYQNEKRKKLACDVNIELYEKIKVHSELKGFKSLNSYIIDLIKKDMNI